MPQITYSKGGEVNVQMPPINLFIVIPTEEVIGPGKTVTLYRPEFAVEARDPGPVTGPVPLVSTPPTIRVQPGKYKIGYSGMIHSHPKLATGTVEFEVKEPVKPVEAFTAWGKEVDGVRQAGIQVGEDRVYKVGETVTLIVRLRNNGKQDVPFIYNSEYFQTNFCHHWRTARSRKSRSGTSLGLSKKALSHLEKSLTCAALCFDLRLYADRKKEESWTLYGTGKFHIQYKDVPVVGEVMLGSSGITLTTGKLELEVKDADDKKPGEPAAKQQKEAFTAWGKEVDGLQAGLGYRAGENRADSHGETVTLVIRVRNVGKEAVKFSYVQPFIEHWPTVTDSHGKPIPQPAVICELGQHIPREVELAQGKEIELYELKRQLRPASESDSKEFM